MSADASSSGGFGGESAPSSRGGGFESPFAARRVRAPGGRERKAAVVEAAITTHGGAIVASAAMRALFGSLPAVGKSGAHVLVRGESGTGKELVARAVHEESARRDRPFVVFDCGAVSASLIESELFGHVPGAFTDAKTARLGRFREAEGGTLLIDEVGDLPLDLQPKLLRVLQSREIRPVGASSPVPVDVRIIAATHRDLEAMRAAGTFRDDLFFRLRVATLKVPPLRERREEIAPLAPHFLRLASELHGRSFRAIAPEALAALERYDWPGNVRELEHTIFNAALFAPGDVIALADLPPEIRAGSAAKASAELDEEGDLPSRLRRYEARQIRRALRAAGGNTEQAALLLGIPRRTLQYRMQVLEIGRTEPN